MSAFVYFVESPAGDPPPTRESLRELCFPHHADAATPGGQVARGPNGMAGYVFPVNTGGHCRRDGLQGFYPDEQTWHKAGDAPWWFAIATGSPPTPHDLVHDDPVFYHEVVLLDGQSWKVPIIRRADGQTTMERPITIVGDGTTPDNVGHLDPEDQRAWELVQRIARRIGGATDVGTTNVELNWLIGWSFARVYRVSPIELQALGLFSNHNAQSVYGALIDLPTFVRTLGGV